MKKALILFIVVGSSLLMLSNPVFAQKQALPLETEHFEDVHTRFAPSGDETGTEAFKSFALAILNVGKPLLAVVAIFFIILSAIKMLFAGGEPEVAKKSQQGILYAVAGLALVSLATELQKIFGFDDGTILSSPEELLERVTLFDNMTKTIIIFIQHLIGAVAVFEIIRSGFRFVTVGLSEEKMTIDKKNIAAALGGLVVIILSNTVVRKVLYVIDFSKYTGVTGVMPGVDPVAGVKEIVGITNFIVSFAGPIAVLMLIVGGILYALAGGEEEKMQKAKRIIVTALIGLVIIFGAFALVSTFISRQFTP